jgi:hypothetical protein
MKRLAGALVVAALVGACGGVSEKGRPPNVRVTEDGGVVTRACHALLPLSDYPDPGSGPVACNALDGFEIYLLDSFEPGEASIAWYTNNDRTAESDPPPDTDPIPSASIPGGRCLDATPSADAPTVCAFPDIPRGECATPLRLASRSAFHMRTGLLTANGGQLGRTLPISCQANQPVCFAGGPPEIGPCSTGQGSTGPTLGCEGYDLSQWEGVVLWARVGPNSADTIKVRVADKATDEKGCVCDPYTDQNDSSTGCDKFSAFVGLDGNFRAYFVPFSEMLQGGWGMQSPGLDTSGLFSFGVEFGRGSWDLLLDDIGFYRRRR